MVSLIPMSKITVLIITFNSSNYILDCIVSINKYYEKELQGGNLRVIILDNNSKDDSLGISEKAIKSFPKPQQEAFEIIKNPQNAGFAKGVNMGVKKSSTPYVLLLNPDAEFQNSNLFEAASYLEKHPEYAVIGAKILNSKGKKEPSAGRIYTILPFLAMLTGTEEAFGVRGSPEKITRVGFVSGGCMLLDTKIFEEMGGFDEHLFMYMEDMEYCLRLKKRGIGAAIYPSLIVSHASHGSSGRPYAIASIYKGVVYIYKKHMPHYLSLVRSLLGLKARILVFIGRISNNEYLVSAYEKALAEIKS